MNAQEQAEVIADLVGHCDSFQELDFKLCNNEWAFYMWIDLGNHLTYINKVDREDGDNLASDMIMECFK